jgi:hypothetical protein
MRMALSIRENATRASAATAGAAAAVVLGVLVVQLVLATIVSAFGDALYYGAGRYGAGAGAAFFGPIGQLMLTLATTILPQVIGVFFVFWLLAPLGAGLSVVAVVLRSLLAAGAGALLCGVFSGTGALGGMFTSAGTLFGNSFPSGIDVGYAVFGTLQTALGTFISATPLILLAGVLTRLWVSRPVPVVSV